MWDPLFDLFSSLAGALLALILPTCAMQWNIYRPAKSLLLGIEITFWGQTKCRIMEKDPTDHSVLLRISKYIDAPSLGTEYGKKQKTDFFNSSYDFFEHKPKFSDCSSGVLYHTTL
jgi:hypothetical protein